MFTNTFSNKITTAIVTGTVVFALLLLATISSANAATYAYVDAVGDVKSVTANDWMSAIAVAPNIHIHSGVMLLTTAADYTIVGDTVAGY